MFLVILTYKKSLAEVDQYLAAHRDYLKSCYAKNQLIASGPQQPRTGGVLLCQLHTRTAVEELIKHDPFHIHDIADYQIIEFMPVLYDKQFKSFIPSQFQV